MIMLVYWRIWSVHQQNNHPTQENTTAIPLDNLRWRFQGENHHGGFPILTCWMTRRYLGKSLTVTKPQIHTSPIKSSSMGMIQPSFPEGNDWADAKNNPSHMPKSLMEGFGIFGLEEGWTTTLTTPRLQHPISQLLHVSYISFTNISWCVYGVYINVDTYSTKHMSMQYAYTCFKVLLALHQSHFIFYHRTIKPLHPLPVSTCKKF